VGGNLIEVRSFVY